MAYPVIFTQLAAGVQPLSDFDTMFNVVGSMGTIFCTATGTNTVALALNTNMPALAYSNYQAYGFVAVNTSTGTVTINVAGLGALPAYAADGATQLGSGNIVAGTYYVFAYNSALNSAAGGLQLISTTPSAVLSNLYVSGTSELAGNVGIGTASGAHALVVIQAGSAQAFFGSTGSNDSTVTISANQTGQKALLQLENGADNKSWSLFNDVSDNFVINQAGGSNFLTCNYGGSLSLGPDQNVFLNQNGQVVINGSGVPLDIYAQLSVYGASAHAISVKAGSSNSCMVFYNGSTIVGSISTTSSATSYNTSSDQRIKTNVTVIPTVNANGNIIDQLQPSAYTFVEAYDPAQSPGVGFVAQQLVNVIPQAVTPGDASAAYGDEGFQLWQVDMTKLVPYLVAELQSVRKRLVVLEAKP